MSSNAALIAMLDELIRLTILEEESPQSFKVRGYEKAKLGIEAHGADIAQLSISRLTAIEGVGKSTASKIREFVDTGTVQKLEELRSAYPPAFAELAKIPGLGPKTLKLIRSELGVENLEDLKAVIDQQRIRTLPRMGATSEAKIAKAIERLGLTGKDRRIPIGEALPLAQRLVDDLINTETVMDATYCGSLRRMSETIGDIDITVAARIDDAPAIMDFVRNHQESAEVVLSGETKTSVLTARGLQVDVRVVRPEEYGAATLYFTGSKTHNIELRQRAMNQGWLLNEYGLVDGDGNVIAAETEESVYHALDLAYVPPPLREATGELQRAAQEGFDGLVTLADIRGDLHFHTDRSGDGRSSLPDMVAEAAARQLDYLAITDHGEDLAINGSTAEEMLEHRDSIRALQAEYPKLDLLFGCELNIGKAGGLDYDADFRSLFDYTVASVHSHYDQSPKAQTERLIAAIEDPTVHSIGHLTGRYIGRRPGIELDIDKLLDALLANDVALEVNGALQRLDAASDVVRRAVDRGVKLVINTDSHHVSELGRMEYGVRTAQRGWAPKELVVNTWPKEQFLAWVASRSA